MVIEIPINRNQSHVISACVQYEIDLFMRKTTQQNREEKLRKNAFEALPWRETEVKFF
jgi:hypothetical protein